MSSAIQPELMLPPTSVTNTTTSAASTAAISLGNDSSGGWYTFSVKTSDLHILFGNSTVAAATTSNALYLPVGAVKDWFIPPGITHFRAIASAAGVLSWARSGP